MNFTQMKRELADAGFNTTGLSKQQIVAYYSVHIGPVSEKVYDQVFTVSVEGES